ncbi:transposable element Tcb2 transposase [Trichonephila clavipes]|nr:transposable element Tcb2 transposase [Trichonephila clavipes]
MLKITKGVEKKPPAERQSSGGKISTLRKISTEDRSCACVFAQRQSKHQLAVCWSVSNLCITILQGSGTVFGDWKCRPKTRATTPNEDRYLVLTARRHRNMNATLLQQYLRSATGTTVSTQNVRTRLHGVGLYPRRPMVCVRLTSRHRRDRME